MTVLHGVIITKNGKLISDALNSAGLADKVLVLDCGFTDKTCDITEGLATGSHQEDWLDFGAQKNKVAELTNNDWVFTVSF